MLVHTLEQAQMPALALLAQIAQPLGRLRPADRVGCVANGIVDVVEFNSIIMLIFAIELIERPNGYDIDCTCGHYGE